MFVKELRSWSFLSLKMGFDDEKVNSKGFTQVMSKKKRIKKERLRENERKVELSDRMRIVICALFAVFIDK